MDDRDMVRMDDREMVQEVNAQFYRALEQLSIEEMEEVWLHDGSVKCIHPGWSALSGWEAIWESWVGIFEHTKMMTVDLSDVEVTVEGDVAWVACVENITSVSERGMSGGQAVATNIFCRTDEGWKLVHHHASPAPAPEGQGPTPGEEET